MALTNGDLRKICQMKFHQNLPNEFVLVPWNLFKIEKLIFLNMPAHHCGVAGCANDNKKKDLRFFAFPKNNLTL